MSRPEFPNCVMTPEIISSIRAEQEYYDQNQEECEQELQRYNEMLIQQREDEYEQQQHEQQIELETKQINNMEKEKIYPKGLRTFKPHENAPEFVKGALIITPSELIKFCEENKDLMTEYNGTPQLKCQMLHGENGIYITVDTWKKTDGVTNEPTVSNDTSDSLPF